MSKNYEAFEVKYNAPIIVIVALVMSRTSILPKSSMFLHKIFADLECKIPHKFWTTFEKSWLLYLVQVRDKAGSQWLFEAGPPERMRT